MHSPSHAIFVLLNVPCIAQCFWRQWYISVLTAPAYILNWQITLLEIKSFSGDSSLFGTSYFIFFAYKDLPTKYRLKNQAQIHMNHLYMATAVVSGHTQWHNPCQACRVLTLLPIAPRSVDAQVWCQVPSLALLHCPVAGAEFKICF